VTRRIRSVRRLVREGWDRLSTVYRPPGEESDCFSHRDADYRRWLRPLVRQLPAGAAVLDLGCGTGVPASRILSDRFQVTGIDLSNVMIRRARQLVPGARFLRMDMTEARFRAGSFHGVVSLYAIIHVPLSEQWVLFRRIHDWLAPGGLFLTIVGHDAWEGTEPGWLGTDVPMFWSHADSATYRKWFESLGFRVVQQAFVPEGNSGGHELFLLGKPRRARPSLRHKPERLISRRAVGS